jgi:hypothetical protein
MLLNSLHELLVSRPFLPFYVRTSSGEILEVAKSEHAMVTRRDLLVGINPRKGVPTEARIIALTAIASVELKNAPLV